MELLATSGRTIAGHMLRAVVLVTVVVIVTQVEGCVGRDVLTAAPALHVASSHERRPSFTLGPVIRAIPTSSSRPTRTVTLPSVLIAAPVTSTRVDQRWAARLGTDALAHATLRTGRS